MKQDIAVLRRVMSFFWTRDGTLMKRRIMMALTAMITAKLIVAGLPAYSDDRDRRFRHRDRAVRSS